MAKRFADDDTGARKRATLEPQLAALPADLIELIACRAGMEGYRNLAATCTRARRVLTLDVDRQSRAKHRFTQTTVSTNQHDIIETFKHFPSGKRHGVAEFRHASTNKVFRREIWEDGVLHGDQEEWNDAGTRIRCTPYVNGKRHGASYRWLVDGVCITSDPYVNGLRQGECYRWDETGRLRYRMQRVNDLRHGTSELWDENGVHIRRDSWKNDKMHGMREYWLNGRLVLREHHNDGLLHGSCQKWNEDGELIHLSYWVNGIMQ